MEVEQCSETLAYELQTLVNDPEASIQLSEHGERVKSIINLNVMLLMPRRPDVEGYAKDL
jgi:hypothetical protein